MKPDLPMKDSGSRPASGPKAKSILDEIVQKVEEYEGRMSSFLSEFNDWSDLFTVKRPDRKRSLQSFSNPRITEMFRAVNALATLETRMMTAQDPYFELVPVDISAAPHNLGVIQNHLENQLRVTEHKRYLLKANTSQILFGTAIVEEPVQHYGLNPYGRRMTATGFVPRPLVQVAFDKNTADIDTADWITTADVYSKHRLLALMRDDPDGKVWIHGQLRAAYDDNSPMENPNQYVLSRLSRAGYSGNPDFSGAREIIIYRGKFDTMNDGVEYIAGVVNRKHLVRFHANRFQHGRRDFRVARWVEFELEPLAYGLGKLLGSLHKSMDANRQKVQDSVTFKTYNMWLRDRMAGILDVDMKIKPFNIVNTDDMNGLRPIPTDNEGPRAGLALEEILRSEFQAASGATATLQALITEATASEVSLAQNEALRNVSIKAELAAEGLVRQHLEVMHANNVEHTDEPFYVCCGGHSNIAYPSDLWYDVDFKTKMVTDKDYRPQRLKSLIETMTVLTSIRNEHPDKYSISIIPIVVEIARSLGIGMENLIVPADQAAANILRALSVKADLSPQASLPAPPAMSPSTQPGTIPVLNTPVGGVFASP